MAAALGARQVPNRVTMGPGWATMADWHQMLPQYLRELT